MIGLMSPAEKIEITGRIGSDAGIQVDSEFANVGGRRGVEDLVTIGVFARGERSGTGEIAWQINGVIDVTIKLK